MLVSVHGLVLPWLQHAATGTEVANSNVLELHKVR